MKAKCINSPSILLLCCDRLSNMQAHFLCQRLGESSQERTLWVSLSALPAIRLFLSSPLNFSNSKTCKNKTIISFSPEIQLYPQPFNTVCLPPLPLCLCMCVKRSIQYKLGECWATLASMWSGCVLNHVNWLTPLEFRGGQNWIVLSPQMLCLSDSCLFQVMTWTPILVINLLPTLFIAV